MADINEKTRISFGIASGAAIVGAIVMMTWQAANANAKVGEVAISISAVSEKVSDVRSDVKDLRRTVESVKNDMSQSNREIFNKLAALEAWQKQVQSAQGK